MKRGFSLIASLIVIVLIVIALFPLLRALSASLFVSADTEANIVALNLVQGKMEELRNLPFDSVSPEAKAQIENFPAFQREVIVTSPQSKLKDIKVIVYWKDSAGSEHNVSLETYEAKY
jgi:type II secretory pathway pseudopilin PulG